MKQRRKKRAETEGNLSVQGKKLTVVFSTDDLNLDDSWKEACLMFFILNRVNACYSLKMKR